MPTITTYLILVVLYIVLLFLVIKFQSRFAKRYEKLNRKMSKEHQKRIKVNNSMVKTFTIAIFTVMYIAISIAILALMNVFS